MSWNWIPCSVSGCVVRIILVSFVFHHDHDDWPLLLYARIGLLDLHRAPPLLKLLAAGLPGSLVSMKRQLEVPGSSFMLCLGPGPPSLLHLTRANAEKPYAVDTRTDFLLTEVKKNSRASYNQKLSKNC
jgi:hypothetical protein